VLALRRNARVIDRLLDAARNVDPDSGKIHHRDLDALRKAAAALRRSDPGQAAALRMIREHTAYSGRINGAIDRRKILEGARLLGAGDATIGSLDRALKAATAKPVNVKPTHLHLALDLSRIADPEARSFPALTRLTLPPGGPAEVRLAADPDRLSIERVTADGGVVPFAIDRGRLIFRAPGARSIEIQHQVRPRFIEQDGDAANATGLIVDRRHAHNVQVTSLLWPYASDQLFPSNADPRAVLTAKVEVSGPQGFVVRGTDESMHVPPYDVAVRCSNNLRRIDGPTTKAGTKLVFWGYRHNALRSDADIHRMLNDAARGIEEVERILGGAAYPDRVVHFEEAQGGLGGMEHQGMPAIYDGAVSDHARLGNSFIEDAIHEMIHAYFGNGVLIDGWENFAVSEGFTQYLTYRAMRAVCGVEWFNADMEDSKRSLATDLAHGSRPLVAPKGSDIHEYFTNVPYELGAQILRMIEHRLGTDRFDGLLGSFWRARRGEPTSIADWARFLTEETGIDHHRFYAAWGRIEGVPHHRYTFKSHDDRLSLRLSSRGARFPLETEVPIRVEGDAGQAKSFVIPSSRIEARRPIQLSVGFRARRVIIDPDKTVLATWKEAREVR
jgi:hypothetical protein